MARPTYDELAVCRACAVPGHCMGPFCHRCRAASLEKFYAELLRTGGLSDFLRNAILWMAIEHPATAFKTRATQLSAWNMMGLLCRPAYIPRRLQGVTSVGSVFHGSKFVLFRNYKYLSVRQRARSNSLGVGNFKTALYWKGRHYNAASLTCFQDYMQNILSFLY